MGRTVHTQVCIPLNPEDGRCYRADFWFIQQQQQKMTPTPATPQKKERKKMGGEIFLDKRGLRDIHTQYIQFGDFGC